jgi:AcrR family transcriptional regulator
MKSQENKTLKKIIKVARELFVADGFNGTSIRDISKKANVHTSLIYHYFSNKVDLWKTVKESLINTETLNSINHCIEQETFVGFLTELVEARFNVFINNPDILRMLDWQRLEKNASLTGIQNFASFDQLEERVAYFQDIGQLTKKYSAKYILLFITSATAAPFIRSYDLDKSVLEESNFVESTVDLLLKAFEVG